MARIAFGGFSHETNSFVPGGTGFERFEHAADRPGFSRGEAIAARAGAINSSTAGFLEALGPGHDLVPTVWGSALAGPPVTEQAYERIAGELLGRLSAALPVDGVYLDLHGAMVAAHCEDGEGELLRRLRAAVGPEVPVAVSLDYHANVTPAMCAHADAMLAYRTYPHVDQRDTGARAAAALEFLLEHGRPGGRALRKAPFLLPLNFQCTLVEPSARVVEAVSAAHAGAISSTAYLAGFPPSDLFHCGPSVVVYAAGQADADDAADALARAVALAEPEFAEPLLDPDEAVRRAMRIAAGASRPVVIADTQDNPGCGGSADTTGVLAALVRNGAEDAVLALLCDAEAARAAHAAGEGAEITVDLGGRTPIEGSEPFHGTFRVERLCDGRLTATGPCARGREMDVGPSALLRIGGVEVAVSSHRTQTHDQAIVRHFGVEPSERAIVVVKSTCHFRADFQPIAEEVLVAVAPGGYVCDPARHPYRRLRRGVRLSPLGAAHEPGNDRR